MATGTRADFIIYDDEFYSGLFERIAQNTTAFNAASRNALQLIPQALKGDYERKSFLKDLTNLVAYRDTTAVGAATAIKMTADEMIGVKTSRSIGPVDNTVDAWRKIGTDMREQSFILGQMIGDHQIANYLNTLLIGLDAAILQTAAINYDGSAGTPSATGLSKILRQFGDASNRLLVWVMHSKSYFDLMDQHIADKVFEVAGVTIHTGTVATLGRPVIVTDAAVLFDAVPVPDQYHILALTEGAAKIKESEPPIIVNELVTGLVNLVYRTQGEYSFNLEVKGHKWDIPNGGANPNDTALGTGTNWDLIFSDVKNLAGCLGRFQ